MAITVLMKEKSLRLATLITRGVGIAIMLLGLVLRLTGNPNAKVAFITGVILILFARINQWWLKFTRKPSAIDKPTP